MLVTLIGKNSIYKIVLPQIVDGNYWITDKNTEKEKKILNIESIDGKWQIRSNSNVKIINPQCVKIHDNNIEISNLRETILSQINLIENAMNVVAIGNTNELFIVYCSPVFEDNLLQLELKNFQEILIGNSAQCNIIYKNALVASRHARIFRNNNKLIIQNLDKKFGTFVNGKPIQNNYTVLMNGDVVFIMGLKFFVIANSLFINNPKGYMTFDQNIFRLVESNKQVEQIQDEETEDGNDDIELYSEDDYFFRAPRITNVIERENVKIDAPPHSENKEEMPAILTIGSSLTMGIIMVISMINSISGLTQGTASIQETVLSFLMSFAMLVSMLLFPILTTRYEKNRKIRYEEKRQKRYKDYLNKKGRYIEKIRYKQRKILFENYVSAEECAKIIFNKSGRLWERKIENHDFLTVRWGIGEVPLNIDIQCPEEQFSMEDDNLIEMVNNLVYNFKTIKEAPIVTSLAEKNIMGFVHNENEKIENIIRNLIIQLIAFHSYEDLKLVFLLKKDNIEKWEYVKMLPHVWDDTKQVRFFADDYDDMKELSKYLEEEFKNRQQYENMDYKSFAPYYLIITDDFKKVENLQIITQILKSKVNMGFSIFCITADMLQLPNECKMFINYQNGKGLIFQNEISSGNQRQIKFDTSSNFYFPKISYTLANIPIRYSNSRKMLLPNSYTFLEMYDVGCIEQLNILDRWRRNDSTLSLKAQVGIDANGMPIALDIHEKFHGPHGLIAGTTGSGKSEFIITYILSLAINYHPDDIAFVLIDYKGGGLAGAFQKKDIKLPHLVGVITNLDKAGLQRSLDSIQSELRRRQVIFNEAKNLVDEGTMDIYKYQKLYHEGMVKKAVPHLIIVCDEFAELKQQQEEFMDELMSVSRIGRSLGVHLILATQKPAGIVNDQIRSNSKFAVCLKVQDSEDSMDLIKRPDAAKLKKAGQFYLQVGNNEYFVLGQSAWSGAPYFPSNVVTKNLDNSVEIISNIGVPIKKLDDSSRKSIVKKGEQLTNVVKYLSELAEHENIKSENLWLENIPETIFVEQIREKYNITNEQNNVNVVIGEFDDPFNQRQGPVNIDLLKAGNIAIYGNAESGKETLLSTIVYDLMTNHSTQEVSIYILDFGTEALKIFKKSPHVGDIVFINDTEKINRFFDMIQSEIDNRKSILSDYNGDYNLFINTSGKPMPEIVIILNNYEAFAENYENEYDDILLILTREGLKCGISFIVTTSAYTDMRYRLTQNFKQKIALQINSEDDYLSIFDNVGKKRPSHMFGRGLISLAGDIYEFQTAKICEAGEYNTHINQIIEKLNAENPVSANPIPVIPDKVELSDVKEFMKDIQTVPIGITKKELKIYNYNFKRNLMNLIVSKNIEESIKFTFYILQLIKNLDDIEIKIFDAEKILPSKQKDLKDNFEKFVAEIENNTTFTLCFIIGIDKLINEILEDGTILTDAIKKAEENENYSFVIVENSNKIKDHEYDEWYKNYISGDTGIWVGNGIDDQYTINISSERSELVNNCGCTFGYVIKQGMATLIKLIGMKEEGEDDE